GSERKRRAKARADEQKADRRHRRGASVQLTAKPYPVLFKIRNEPARRLGPRESAHDTFSVECDSLSLMTKIPPQRRRRAISRNRLRLWAQQHAIVSARFTASSRVQAACRW